MFHKAQKTREREINKGGFELWMIFKEWPARAFG